MSLDPIVLVEGLIHVKSGQFSSLMCDVSFRAGYQVVVSLSH